LPHNIYVYGAQEEELEYHKRAEGAFVAAYALKQALAILYLENVAHHLEEQVVIRAKHYAEGDEKRRQQGEDYIIRQLPSRYLNACVSFKSVHRRSLYVSPDKGKEIIKKLSLSPHKRIKEACTAFTFMRSNNLLT
jgi:hypothetical protein